MKRCPGCGENKPLSEFNKGSEKGGVQAYCRSCGRERSLAVYYRRKAARPGGYPRASKVECVECGETKAGDQFYRRAASPTGVSPYCKPCHRIVEAAAKYGITRDAARTLLATGATCQICGAMRGLVIDHCHETTLVRGVLCRTCNIGIGHLRHNPELLRAALTYLAH